MSVLDQVTGFPAYALIRFKDGDTVTVLGGEPTELPSLAEVPLEAGRPAPGRRYDRLLAVPYSQVRERGFEAHDDGTPLTSVTIRVQQDVPVAELLSLLPDEPVDVVGERGFDVADDDYAKTVEAVIRDQIGQGAGANLVIGRSYRATIAGWGTATALTVFRRLLEQERNAYWTFCVFTGERYLIGATPERHISVQADEVRMNPISGTFRLRGLDDPAARKRALLEFLADEKEIFELFMVVDEELKMMCDICSEGGQVLGPFLKPMTHLMHTEYILSGRTGRDVREVLRDSMYAATVTGSPVENACRLIKAYEPQGRGYYGAVLALLGRDEAGRPTADAPILIRTAEVSPQGRLRITAGATLVRDSDPAYEVAETHAKAAGILSAFGLGDAAPTPATGGVDLALDEDVLVALGSRNQRLSKFWLTDQSATPPVPELAGRRVLVMDNEDDFVNMLRHVLAVLGMRVDVVRWDAYDPAAAAAYDLVVVGPGPGDPRDLGDPKIAAVRRALDRLLAGRTPFLAVCLGHQVLCAALGMSLHYKDIVFQGTQTAVEVLGRRESVGFYNTFVARAGDAGLPQGVTVESDPASGDVHLVCRPGFRGVQFHAESILTEHGFQLVRDLAAALLSPTPAG